MKIKTASLLLSALLIILTCLCSCKNTVKDGESTENTAVTAEPHSNSENASQTDESSIPAELKNLQNSFGEKILGAAFLGYIDTDEENGLKGFVEKNACCTKYPFLLNAHTVDFDGNEVFAFVPKSSGYSISITKAKLNENGDYENLSGDVLYEGSKGEAVILKCNESDIYSNVTVTVKGEGGFSFQPSVSLKDGKLSKGDYHDFSCYETASQNIKIATELLLENPEVIKYVENGASLIYTGESVEVGGRPMMLFAVGKNSGDSFVREHLFAVSDNLVCSYDALNDEWSVAGN